ncbi:SlyX family protein [Pseudohongiella sp. SYSU M77423]|uniref:SlyX family protein n=1 Tax=unclassified Pseudohongiella TaxID=2629611 RepID=UPI001F471F1B|nr:MULTISPECIES: SlyX family protein [unclassified Pseudohongiella]MDH7944459.1 SlyX family protein [Pseudohongiella sp. SYSU M77423]MEC8858605.1 SlyX family protein [Pseudomonadota bacterium]
MMTDDQLVDLQTRIAFQEDSLSTLNDVIARQQQQIDALERELALHRDKITELLEIQAERSISPGAQEEKPPHY